MDKAPKQATYARRTRAEWTAEVVRWRQSGLNSAAYAEAHGLHRATLLYWSTKLGRDVVAPAAPPVETEPVAFVPLRMRPQQPPKLPEEQSACVMEVLLCNGRRVRVTGDVHPQELARLVSALEGHNEC